MLIKYRKFVLLVVSLQIFFVFAASGLASTGNVEEGVPPLPLILRGDLNVNGVPVSEGSEILTYYEGELIGKYTVNEEGKFSLKLNLAPADYVNFEDVKFYINENEAELEFSESDYEAIKNVKGPGSDIKVKIQAYVDSSSSSSSSSDGDEESEVKIVNKDEQEELEDSDEGFEDGEDDSGVLEDTYQAEDDAKSRANTSDNRHVSLAIISIIAILGVILVIRKILLD